jgi:CheY-like chemotaxis protein/AraC-like DNA-binding protein
MISTFTISLQTGRNHLKESEIISETVFTEDFKGIPLLNKQSNFLEEDNQHLNNGKKYQLLLAEDNEEVRKLIIDILINEYHVVDFANGLEAMEYMKTEIPDLIISDIMMPIMDGIELCNQVKNNESTNHIPMILLTAKASIAYQVDGLSSGADAYISKPFSPQVLTLNIKNLLKAKEVMREKFSQQITLEPSKITITSPEEKFINKLLQIIENKMGDPEFNVNELVNEIGMSRTVLYKKVQALTNYPVADLIKQMRLKKAAELFKTATFPIAEVAYMVGFNDRKHFSKEFKKQFEVSPSEYIHNFHQV